MDNQAQKSVIYDSITYSGMHSNLPGEWVNHLEMKNGKVEHPNCNFNKRIYQGWRGHWVVYYTSPQSIIVTIYNFLCWLNKNGEFY